MAALPIACGGFLLAVLWFDLMFDVQVLRHRQGDLPESVLGSIAAYYRRVTTDAQPMSFAVGIVMLVGLAAVVGQLVSGSVPRWASVTSLALAAAPIGLALRRVLPNAARLGSRVDPIAVQSALARQICSDHLFCLAAIAGFLAVQLTAVAI
jgi:hypothetical protein